MDNRNLFLLLAGVGTCIVVLANIMLTENTQAMSAYDSQNGNAPGVYYDTTTIIYHDTTSVLPIVYKLLLKQKKASTIR